MSPDEPASTTAERDRRRLLLAFNLSLAFVALLVVVGLVLLVITVWMEVTAQPALGWALGLLAILLALYGMIRLRRRLPARTATRRN